MSKTHAPIKGLTEIVAIDVATTGNKVVRMKKSKEGISVVGLDILPASTPEEVLNNGCIVLPKSLKTRQAALSISGENAVIRLITMRETPGRSGVSLMPRIKEQLGLDDQFRLSYTEASQGKLKGERKFLAVGIPEQDVQSALCLVETGLPAPLSMQVSGLSALTSFRQGPCLNHQNEAVGVIDCGAKTTLLSMFKGGTLMLVRKFDFGGDKLVDKVKESLKVDPEVASQIIVDGSFDISQAVQADLNPFLRQLTISRDYVERHDECRISRFYASGGMSLCKFWRDAVSQATGVKVYPWNPLEGITVAPDAVPETMKGQWPRFTAAIGAGLAMLRAG